MALNKKTNKIFLASTKRARDVAAADAAKDTPENRAKVGGFINADLFALANPQDPVQSRRPKFGMFERLKRIRRAKSIAGTKGAQAVIAQAGREATKRNFFPSELLSGVAAATGGTTGARASRRFAGRTPRRSTTLTSPSGSLGSPSIGRPRLGA